MADPFSVAAGVAGVVSLTIQVTQVTIRYVKGVKNASRSMQALVRELNALRKILLQLDELANEIDEEDLYGGRPSALITVVDAVEYRHALEELRERLEKRMRGNSLAVRLKSLSWPFSESDTEKTVGLLHRHFELFKGALSIDNRALGIETLKRVKTLTNERHDARSRAILDWLAPSEMFQKLDDVSSRRQGKTGSWLLQTENFINWLEKDKSPSTLWCPGQPGGGKTVLASTIINHLLGRYLDEEVGIAFLFCDYKDEKRQTASELVGTLVKQLAARQQSLPQQLQQLYDNNSKEGRRPTFEQLKTLLLSQCTTFKRTYVVIDALDETHFKTRKPLLDVLRILEKSMVRVLVTSRPNSEQIRTHFINAPQITIVAHKDDIETYVRENLEKDDVFMQRINPDIQDQIIGQITNKSSGMFLMAVLQLKQITEQRTITRVLKALSTLPTGIGDIYDSALERIRNQAEADVQLGMRVLQWLSYANRPLLVEEFCHALAIDFDETSDWPSDLDRDNLLDPSSLLDVCAGLAVVEKESGVIRLVHFTAQEHFNKKRDMLFPSAKIDFAKTCLIYLSFTPFMQGYCSPHEELAKRLEEYPFFDYAAHYWSQHLPGGLETKLQDLALRVLDDDSIVSSFTQVAYGGDIRPENYKPDFFIGMTGIHLTAALGLKHLASQLLQRQSTVRAKSHAEWTPLHFASWQGMEAIVRLLLDNGAEIDMKEIYGRTALHLASFYGFQNIVELLLSRGAGPAVKDEVGQCPLHFAARRGHKKIVGLLVEKMGGDTQVLDDEQWTALHRAAEFNHFDVARILLDANANVHATDLRGWTAFHVACARRDSINLIELFLDRGVGVNQTTRDHYKTALMWASEIGLDQNVDILLREGADVGRQDKYGETALHYAAEGSHVSCVRLLLNHNADTEILDYNGRTPIDCAGKSSVQELMLEQSMVSADSQAGSLDAQLRTAVYTGDETTTIQILLNGLDLNTFNRVDRDTVLHLAAWKGYTEITRRLLTSDIQVDARGKAYGTALHRAVSYGHEPIVRLLVEFGANINAITSNEDTPLELAAVNGHQGIVRYLLSLPNIIVSAMSSDTGGTPLVGAARYGHTDITRQLLEKGASPLEWDRRHLKPALTWAAEWGHTETVRLFLISGGLSAEQLNAPDKYGETALHYSAGNGFEEIVRLLLEYGADRSVRDNNYVTPAQHAEKRDQHRIVRLLEEGEGFSVEEDAENKESDASSWDGLGYPTDSPSPS